MSENTNEKLTVLDFVNKYRNSTSDSERDELVSSIIKRTYVPVLEKQVVLEQFLNKSISTGAYNVKFINSFLAKVNVVIAILLMYTKLDLSKNNDTQTNSFDDYDLLKEFDLIDLIYNKIGEKELKELKSIYDGIVENFEKEFKTVESYIAKQTEKFATIFGEAIAPGLDRLMDIINDENKLSKYAKKIKPMIK